MAHGHSSYLDQHGAVGAAPQDHNVVFTTLHFDQPWTYENYLKAGGYQALRKILTEKMSPLFTRTKDITHPDYIKR